jgi:hypothetical protein
MDLSLYIILFLAPWVAMKNERVLPKKKTNIEDNRKFMCLKSSLLQDSEAVACPQVYEASLPWSFFGVGTCVSDEKILYTQSVCMKRTLTC